ncbi:MAG: RING finger domain-containing protein [bacterium]
MVLEAILLQPNHLELFKYLIKEKLKYFENNLLSIDEPDFKKLKYLLCLDNPIAELSNIDDFENKYQKQKARAIKIKVKEFDFKRKRKEIGQALEDLNVKKQKTEEELYEKRKKIEAELKAVKAIKDLETFSCPICYEDLPIAVLDYMPNLIITKCGHAFHKECLLEALKHKNECPVCRTKSPLEFYL